MTEAVSYTIATEIPASYMEKLFDFIYKQYLLPQKQRFTNFSRETTDGVPFLSYVVLDAQGKHLAQSRSQRHHADRSEVNPHFMGQCLPRSWKRQNKTLSSRCRYSRKTPEKQHLYFAWREGEDIVPEKLKKKEKSFNRLFLETQILFFVVFIAFGMVIFIILTSLYPDAFWIAPIILIAVQFVFVFYSSNFIARTADWHITEANPIIHLLKYHLPIKKMMILSKPTLEIKLLAIKKEIYDEILAKHGEIDCEAAQKVFAKHGIACQPENLAAKKVNVYELVKKIADKFGFPMPKIVVSNTMVPNAAAAGPSPSRGVVLITTGLLVQLEEDEILSVLGHEFGHLKGRDPLHSLRVDFCRVSLQILRIVSIIPIYLLLSSCSSFTFGL